MAVQRGQLSGSDGRRMLGWSYPPNVEADEDIRILVAQSGSWPMSARGEILPEPKDYWLFDSSDPWAMEYADDGRSYTSGR
jgi:hypothetical protein